MRVTMRCRIWPILSATVVLPVPGAPVKLMCSEGTEVSRPSLSRIWVGGQGFGSDAERRGRSISMTSRERLGFGFGFGLGSGLGLGSGGTGIRVRVGIRGHLVHDEQRGDLAHTVLDGQQTDEVVVELGEDVLVGCGVRLRIRLRRRVKSEGELWKARARASAGRGGGGAGSRASAFKQQLGGLVRSMAATRCHYVRCVNPRAAAASALQGKPPPPPPPTAGLHSATADRVARDRARGVPTVPTAAETETEMDMEVVEQLAAAAAGLEQEFDAPRVLAQLQALGTLQAVQMARHGYPDL